MTTTVQPVRVALVGANWGLSHLAAWRSVPGVTVVGVCTAHRESAERVAREHNLPAAYWDAEGMMSGRDIDIVDVMLRPNARIPLVFAALRQHKNVLQPLPFAHDLPEANQLAQDAASAGVMANVEALHRYAPVFRQAKALIDDGLLGTVYTIEAFVRTGTIIDIPNDYIYDWITRAGNGASAVRNWGAQMLHVLLWLFGDVSHVAAANATMQRDLRLTDGTTRPNETPDTTLALLRYENGAIGSLHTTWSTPAGEGFTIDVAGSEGRLVLRADRLGPQNARILAATRNAEQLTEVPFDAQYAPLATVLGADPQKGREYPLAAMCFAYAQALRTGDAGVAGPSFADARRVLEIVEAIYRADSSQAWVPTAN